MSERLYGNIRTAKSIEVESTRWRTAFEVPLDSNLNMLDLIANRLPELISEFEYKVATENELDIADEGLTTFCPPCIQLRRDVHKKAENNEPRAKFTLAHELGHLVMHKGFKGEALARSNIVAFEKSNPDVTRDLEWQANTFASRFLMPTDLVGRYDNIEDITLDFGVSREAAALRLEQINKSKPKQLPPHIKDLLNDWKRKHGYKELD